MTNDRVSYKCLSCNYKFKRARESTSSKICPNCGKKNVTLDGRNEASNILKESSSRQFDF